MNGNRVKIEIFGMEVVTRTQRRYVVIGFRPEKMTMLCRVCHGSGSRQDPKTGKFGGCSTCGSTGHATYAAFTEIVKRSDNLRTARTAAQRWVGIARGLGCQVRIFDTANFGTE